MDSKEEKKERRQGYFARLKRKKTGKQNAELTSAAASNKDDPLKVILGQTPEKASDEEKKKKRGQGKQLRRNEIKRHSAGELQNNKNEKKEKKMLTTQPLGTVEYTATSKDTLNTIALAFNVTPNKLVEMNKLFSHMILPGQVLYVPCGDPPPSNVKESSCGVIASTGSSDAEYDKLPDADLARTASKPIERVLSSTSEEEEASEVKFLKMNCRYITDGKGVVGGVMIVTPNNVMFDPHKSDPLVIENGCEEYGHICPMTEVVSIALYNDISHMKLKDALPSDRPKDLCPLYRPGEWEDLSSEKDLNPFSKFKSMNKGKRKNGVTGVEDRKMMEADVATEPDTNKQLDNTPTVQLNVTNADIKDTERSNEIILSSNPKNSNQSPTEDDFIELVETLVQQNGNEICDQSEGTVVSPGIADSRISNSAFTQEDLNFNETTDSVDKITIEDAIHEPLPEHKNLIDTKNIKLCLSPTKEKNSNPTDCVNSKSCEAVINVPQNEASIRTNSNSEKTDKSTAASLNAEKAQSKLSYASDESPDSLSPCSPEDNSKKATQMDSESELKMWLQKRMQGPIEDMLPSKEEKSKNPPMFLCVKVGKPMRKSFAAQTSATVQHDWKRKQLEYWFAVPQERVDDLYVFFLQCSPEVYGKDAKDQGFVVVDKEELDMIDNFFSDPSTKSWEIINVKEANRRKSTGSYEDEEEEAAIEEFLPDLKEKSLLLEDMHIKKLARRLPARVQGYPWHLMYSLQVHGASLKTLYRNLGSLDSPVLLVVKDMDNQVFGAYATHPFRVGDHYYGTGETFLFTFSPDFKAFKWSGDNSYFINGDTASLALGGGGSGFGLWLDSDLYHGRSNSCGTFKNDILSKKEDFVVQDIEVWTFK
ncbi:nuclear receptor coactivator 7 isoform X2 [Rana temporaria]|uniref:nuclear receptor coactivator 7 isoform X2 n=1 Tax=Rana temporaria TaxID=8407 RepID=UPI001AAD066F|nr:nuclear receptor coactivator 7 isoform X2 [Rana temporaria]